MSKKTAHVSAPGPSTPGELFDQRQLSRMEDIPASEPLPHDLIAHLKLRYRPGQTPIKTAAKRAVSAPPGYAPRFSAEFERGIDVGVVAHGHELTPGKQIALPQRIRASSIDSYRPPHLQLQRVPQLMSSPSERTEQGDAGLAQLRRAEVTGWGMLAWPWCAIGRIDSWSEGNLISSGSAFLVGRNLLVTASHCMPWQYSGNCTVRFIPAYSPGTTPPFGETYVSEWHGHRNEGNTWDLVTKPDAKDYVICRLDDPIGDVCGWMGVRSFTDHTKYLRRGYMSAGYPSYAQGSPVFELDVRVRDVDGDNDGRELESERFGGPGWSGGPLFGWFGDDLRAVGVCHGKETEFVFPGYRVNVVFAGGKHLVNLVRYGQANWPA